MSTQAQGGTLPNSASQTTSSSLPVKPSVSSPPRDPATAGDSPLDYPSPVYGGHATPQNSFLPDYYYNNPQPSSSQMTYSAGTPGGRDAIAQQSTQPTPLPPTVSGQPAAIPTANPSAEAFLANAGFDFKSLPPGAVVTGASYANSLNAANGLNIQYYTPDQINNIQTYNQNLQAYNEQSAQANTINTNLQNIQSQQIDLGTQLQSGAITQAQYNQAIQGLNTQQITAIQQAQQKGLLDAVTAQSDIDQITSNYQNFLTSNTINTNLQNIQSQQIDLGTQLQSGAITQAQYNQAIQGLNTQQITAIQQAQQKGLLDAITAQSDIDQITSNYQNFLTSQTPQQATNIAVLTPQQQAQQKAFDDLNTKLTTIQAQDIVFNQAVNAGKITLPQYKEAMVFQNQQEIQVLGQAEAAGFISETDMQNAITQMNQNILNVNNLLKQPTPIMDTPTNPLAKQAVVFQGSTVIPVYTTNPNTPLTKTLTGYQIITPQVVTVTPNTPNLSSPLQQGLFGHNANIFGETSQNPITGNPVINTQAKASIALDVSTLIVAPEIMGVRAVAIGAGIGVALQEAPNLYNAATGKPVTLTQYASTALSGAAQGVVFMGVAGAALGAIGKVVGGSTGEIIAGTSWKTALAESARYTIPFTEIGFNIPANLAEQFIGRGIKIGVFAGIGAGYGATSQYLTTGKVTAENVALNAGIGAGFGVIGEVIGFTNAKYDITNRFGNTIKSYQLNRSIANDEDLQASIARLTGVPRSTTTIKSTGSLQDSIDRLVKPQMPTPVTDISSETNPISTEINPITGKVITPVLASTSPTPVQMTGLDVRTDLIDLASLGKTDVTVGTIREAVNPETVKTFTDLKTIDSAEKIFKSNAVSFDQSEPINPLDKEIAPFKIKTFKDVVTPETTTPDLLKLSDEDLSKIRADPQSATDNQLKELILTDKEKQMLQTKSTKIMPTSSEGTDNELLKQFVANQNESNAETKAIQKAMETTPATKGEYWQYEQPQIEEARQNLILQQQKSAVANLRPINNPVDNWFELEPKESQVQAKPSTSIYGVANPFLTSRAKSYLSRYQSQTQNQYVEEENSVISEPSNTPLSTPTNITDFNVANQTPQQPITPTYYQPTIPRIIPITIPTLKPTTTPLTVPISTPISTPITNPITVPVLSPIVAPIQNQALKLSNQLIQIQRQPPIQEIIEEPTLDFQFPELYTFQFNNDYFAIRKSHKNKFKRPTGLLTERNVYPILTAKQFIGADKIMGFNIAKNKVKRRSEW